MWLARLLYFSSRLDGSRSALDGIFEISRSNNLRDSITGALISFNRHFVQLLEGDRTAINRCLTRIMRDPRHHDIQVVSAGGADRRMFEHWSMRRIEATEIRNEVLERYLVNGSLEPSQMSQFALEHLCRSLSASDWQVSAT